MKRDFWIYSALLVAGLGLAYYFSFDEKHSHNDQTEYVKINPKEVTEVVYESPESSVKATRASDGVFWITFTPAAKENLPAETPKFFKANKKFTQVLDDFNPLFIDRILTDAKKADMAEYGIKDSKASLQIKGGDKALFSLVIGKKSYGNRKLFVLDKLNDKVLLLDDKHINKLEKADKQLFDNQLYDVEPEEVTAAEIEFGGKKKAFAHTKRDGAGQLQWTEAKDDAKVKPAVKTWMEKLDKLRLMKYADDAQDKALQNEPSFLQVYLKSKSGPPAKMAFKKQLDGAETKYWVLSSYSGRHAEVTSSRVDPLEKDVPTILNE